MQVSEGVCLLPLFDFRTSINKFDLGHGVLVRSIMSSEIERIQKEGRWKGWPFDHFDMPRINYTLEKRTKLETKEVGKTLKQFLNLILTMRLFKQGAVGYKAAVILVDGKPVETYYFGVHPRYPAGEDLKKYPIVALTLHKGELKEFVLFNRKVVRFGGLEDKWPLPFRYFSRMYEEIPLEDILLNCMIGFEALIFRGEKEEREKQTALALSISMLIGKNSKEREKVKTAIREAYNLRNNIIHGKHPYKSRIEIAVLCWEIEDYLRRCIRKLIIEE